MDNLLMIVTSMVFLGIGFVCGLYVSSQIEKSINRNVDKEKRNE